MDVEGTEMEEGEIPQVDGTSDPKGDLNSPARNLRSRRMQQSGSGTTRSSSPSPARGVGAARRGGARGGVRASPRRGKGTAVSPARGRRAAARGLGASDDTAIAASSDEFDSASDLDSSRFSAQEGKDQADSGRTTAGDEAGKPGAATECKPPVPAEEDLHDDLHDTSTEEDRLVIDDELKPAKKRKLSSVEAPTSPEPPMSPEAPASPAQALPVGNDPVRIPVSPVNTFVVPQQIRDTAPKKILSADLTPQDTTNTAPGEPDFSEKSALLEPTGTARKPVVTPVPAAAARSLVGPQNQHRASGKSDDARRSVLQPEDSSSAVGKQFSEPESVGLEKRTNRPAVRQPQRSDCAHKAAQKQKTTETSTLDQILQVRKWRNPSSGELDLSRSKIFL